jgi:hypothetical protein
MCYFMLLLSPLLLLRFFIPGDCRSTLLREVNSTSSNQHRMLSTKFDPFTGESLQTYNGQVPVVTCPIG